MTWYKCWCYPYGKPTCPYEESFPQVAGRTVCVRRYRRGRSWEYIPHNWTDGRGQVIRKTSLAAAIAWLETAIAAGDVPCT